MYLNRNGICIRPRASTGSLEKNGLRDLASASIEIHDRFEAVGDDARKIGFRLAQRALDQRSDAREGCRPVQKRFNGDLIRGVQNGGRGPPARSDSFAIRRAGKRAGSGSSKVKWPAAARSSLLKSALRRAGQARLYAIGVRMSGRLA